MVRRACTIFGTRGFFTGYELRKDYASRVGVKVSGCKIEAAGNDLGINLRDLEFLIESLQDLNNWASKLRPHGREMYENLYTVNGRLCDEQIFFAGTRR